MVKVNVIKSDFIEGHREFSKASTEVTRREWVPPSKGNTLTLQTTNPCILTFKAMEYAARGPVIQRALQIESELKSVSSILLHHLFSVCFYAWGDIKDYQYISRFWKCKKLHLGTRHWWHWRSLKKSLKASYLMMRLKGLKGFAEFLEIFGFHLILLYKRNLEN